jgi:hypothetical protein
MKRAGSSRIDRERDSSSCRHPGDRTRSPRDAYQRVAAMLSFDATLSVSRDKLRADIDLSGT